MHNDDDSRQSIDSTFNSTVTRRDFMKYTAGTVACISLGSLTYGCGSSSSTKVAGYPIDSTVVKTAERMITFPYRPPTASPAPGSMPNPADPPTSPNGGTAMTWSELNQTQHYDALGYGEWEYVNQPLPIVTRTDIMGPDYGTASGAKKRRLLNFFAMTDVHLTDKEAPNQLLFLQQSNAANAGQNSSIFSGILPYTPHVFDAAVQTANALHKQDSFDFFISLGDVSNSSMYNELRWYIDIIDGKVITPSSGDHIGASTVDYQKPFKAAGLDKSIPFYQTLGNHDHFMIGSFPVYENNLQSSYTSDTVWAVPDKLLTPKTAKFPALFDVRDITNPALAKKYQGVLNGASFKPSIINAGDVENYSTPPKVAADPDRRPLHRTEWIQEFFNTTTGPKGHGFNLVSSNPNFHLVPVNERAGFACYSFVPKSAVPLKVIVLDNTQREDDGSVDIHGHGFLDATRWAWLQAELDDGQDANQLMIIAAHIPIAVANVGTELEWWRGSEVDATATMTNAVDLAGLVAKLQSSTNLLMWISGHRHLNTIKALKSPDTNAPEKGFWQVETSSLHDFPQQFRTFEIFVNDDYTVSIEAVNVDIACAEETPAAKSRKYAIATQQIIHSPLTQNPINYQQLQVAPGVTIPLPAMDPTRPQGGVQGDSQPTDSNFTDPSIQFLDLKDQGVPYNASYNARLYKQLSPAMKTRLQELFPSL